MSADFISGDEVISRSSGRKMIFLKKQEDGRYKCTWFEANGSCGVKTFEKHEIKKKSIC
ncbi:hypothetical protein [Piscirickettsia litoralis]|uniref:hypothetical protein n=1 Tax=Piscirickettsia litoralis TaxID=1891921 RepID=UPI0013013952|nr:hypothetical protein [Piscirickettsia litoralis]